MSGRGRGFGGRGRPTNLVAFDANEPPGADGKGGRGGGRFGGRGKYKKPLNSNYIPKDNQSWQQDEFNERVSVTLRGLAQAKALGV